jgi:hypothetical protein
MMEGIPCFLKFSCMLLRFSGNKPVPIHSILIEPDECDVIVLVGGFVYIYF